MEITANSNMFGLSEQHYGKIKRVGMLNNEPILYGDPNLLKNNDLYYIIGAKQVYRYVKCEIRHTGSASIPSISDPTTNPVGGNVFDPNDTSKVYYFETFNGSDSEVLSVPEDERGKIRNAGYLFNEIIYSGDPNLVDNGQLFYHDTLPYISVISNVDGIINVSTKKVRIDGTIVTIVNEYRVSPEPHDYSKDYLTFEALEDGTFTLSIPASVDSIYMTSISYSTDDGETWTTTTVDNTAQTITTPTINAGDKVLWKGVGKSMAISSSSNKYSQFSSTGNFSVSGNIMSLLYGDEFANQVAFPSSSTYNFCCLFKNNNKLISVENLILLATTLKDYCYWYMFSGCTSLTTAPSILPATTLAESCYSAMFRNCTSLTTAPELSATILANYCYNSMFSGCTALTTAPELPATTLAQFCYGNMFDGCKALTTAPELPATTLATQCYFYMFNGCTALTTAPELPATTLVESCYNYMFQGCTRLNYIKAMFITTPSTTYTYGWVGGVAATGTFVKNKNATWTTTGDNGIPTGWTVETANADTNEITI